MSHLSVTQLAKSFSTPAGAAVAAVRDISFALAAGELLAVVGPSGSGKTTLLRLIAGLETPETGQIQMGGTDVTALAPAARDVALVFQSHALFPHFTAAENIGFGLKLQGTPASQIQTRVAELATHLGLSQCLTRRPAALSGGERQRVALARALARRPQVLLLDEPFAQLDEPLRRQLRADLPRWREQFQTTIILVTHDQAEALAVGDRVLVLRQGRSQQIGTPREIYQHPANLFVAGFIGTPPMNLWPVRVAYRDGHLGLAPAAGNSEGWLDLGGARADWFAANVDRAIVLGIPSEHLSVVAPTASPWRGVVTGTEFLGADCLIRVTLGNLSGHLRQPADHPIGPGETIGLQVNWTAVRVFDAVTGVPVAF